MKKFTYIFLAGILWGLIGVSVKLINNEINPFSLNFFRFVTAFLVLLVLCPLIDRSCLKMNRKDVRSYVIIGFLFALTSSLFVYAISRTTISDTVLLQSVQPFFLMFIAYFWLREKITVIKVITLIAGLVGIYIINPLTTGDLIGNISALISGLLFAVLTAYMRYEDKKMHHTSTLWYMFFAALFMIPFPFIFGAGLLLKNIFYILMLGGLGTGIAYLFYNLALEKMEAEIAALFAMILLPLSSIILGVIFIREIPSLAVIVGGLILIGSGVYLELHSKKVRS
ncbi:DMT family transporter [Candidatus Woesearchaeota archaeon]|nr:DMT family transporter [Candidatus Woesearchaeota archaeon]